jgi:4-aminobutyrate aminotransferase-like enzyme
MMEKLPQQTHNARLSTLNELTDEQLAKLAADLGNMLRHQLKACASTHEVLGDVVDAALARRR